jgi:hypothetical protein
MMMGDLAMDDIRRVNNAELMADAEGRVKPQYPTAVQVKNIGSSTRGPAEIADDINKWTFVFTDIDGLSIITLDYLDGRFAKSVRVAEPWTETEILELPRSMDLSEAVSIMRRAGYQKPFDSVTLRAPVIAEEDPSYIFKMGRDLVFVSALNGKVSEAHLKA